MKFRCVLSSLIFIIFGIVISSNRTFSQGEWQNFATDTDATEGQEYGEYLWVGTKAGLSRINKTTKETSTFNPANSELPRMEFEFKLMSDGRLWLGSDSQIGIFDDGEFSPLNIQLNADIDYFISIHTDSQDNAYVSFRDKNSDFKYLKISLDGEITYLSRRVLAIDSQDRIWSSNSQGYVILEDDNGTITFNSGNSTLFGGIGSDIGDIIPMDNTVFVVEAVYAFVGYGDIWSLYVHAYKDGDWRRVYITSLYQGAIPIINCVGIDDSTIVYSDSENRTIYRIENDVKESINFPSYNDVKLIAQTSDEIWWLYIDNYENNRIHTYDPEIGESSLEEIQVTDVNIASFIRHLFIDTNNEVWVYSQSQQAKGLSHFNGEIWKKIKDLSDGIDAIAEDGNGNLWFTDFGDNTLLKYNKNSDQLEGILCDCEDDPESAMGLYIDKFENIWTWTNCGLSKYDGFTWEYFDHTNSPIAENSFHEIMPGRDGKFYFYKGSNLYQYNGETIEVVETPDSTSSLRFVYEDSFNKVWLRQSSTFGYIFEDEFHSVDIDIQDFDPIDINDMTQDSKGVYWFATDVGLLRYDGASWQFRNDGLPRTYIFGVDIDAFDNVWVFKIHQAGITVYNENGIANIGSGTLPCLKGTVYLDVNQNGIQEVAEVPIQGIPIKISPDNVIKYTNYAGNFKLTTEDIAERTIEPFLTDEWTLTSAQENYIESPIIDCVEDLDFGLQYLGEEVNMQLDQSFGFPRCNSQTSLWITVWNKGFTEFSGRLEIEFDELLTLEGMDAPYIESGDNTFSVDLNSIPFQQFIKVNCTVDLPGVDAIGESLLVKSNLIHDTEVIATSQSNDELVCSSDPNDKLVQSTGETYEDLFLKDDELIYTIRFENSGTDTAFQVRVVDTLSQSLDLSTFQYISSSHEVDITLRGQEVTFEFPDIILPHTDVDPINSQGYVTFQIGHEPDIEMNTTIENEAAIYFDYNPPIITNTTENTVVNMFPSSTHDLVNTTIDCSMEVSPNPVLEQATITLDQNFIGGNWSVLTLDGKLIEQRKIENTSFVFNKSDMESGIYLIKADYNGQSCMSKMIVID